MTPPFAELHARIVRIAARADVEQQVAVDAVLGRAGIAETLAALSDAELEQVLIVAREWDAADDDEHDPDADVLYAAVAEWLRLRAGRGGEA